MSADLRTLHPNQTPALESLPMHVDVRKASDVIIVDLEGKLVRGLGDELLRNVINELLAEGWKKILLNLSEVPTVDSSGIGELVGGLKIARRFGASIKVLRLSPRVRTTLIRSQILPLFEIYDEEDEAVESFGVEPGTEAAEGRAS